ncbi:DUF3747 domain-containing protein [Thermocoleostomius sinensis]|uniref:DUF3747 domain-containing protein n=1 Tax=Thermocoleostomius sinensis A174 TaxID=2016057 RepID=A0A9E8ZFW8_9CYAN|nr:DUF3747 domain-containing protein [Thermocoleostomius sinensis]WAL60480.1 DUF3747 domain-containing protein [Thermocoleostomius sinensis A174]
MRLGTRTKTIFAACSAALTTLFVTHSAWAVGGFGQSEVEQTRFIAVAAPVGNSNERQLLILEQISDDRPCWTESGSNPTVVDPLMLSFDFTGICGRSTDANGYSLRINGQDLALHYQFRIEQRSNDLVLVASLNDPANRDAPDIEVGRTNGLTNGFARINLNPGWRFTKRTLNDRVLGHVYVTYEGIVPESIVLPPALVYTVGDIAFDVYGPEIQQAIDAGFISGFEDNTFRPQDTLTREQLVSMVLESLSRIPNLNIVLPTTASSSPYVDVEASRWSAAKIQFARDTNIVSGYQDGTFRPTQPVTRAEMIAVLRRAAEYSKAQQGASIDLQPSQQPIPFSDTSGHWAESLITQMSAYCGIATPVNDRGTAFAPDAPTLRNYAAAATLRMFNCSVSPPAVGSN